MVTENYQPLKLRAVRRSVMANKDSQDHKANLDLTVRTVRMEIQAWLTSLLFRREFRVNSEAFKSNQVLIAIITSIWMKTRLKLLLTFVMDNLEMGALKANKVRMDLKAIQHLSNNIQHQLQFVQKELSCSSVLMTVRTKQLRTMEFFIKMKSKNR